MPASPDTSRLTRDTLTAIRELDFAIANHVTWLKRLHGVLIANTPGHADDLCLDAHHRCEFGAWFYGVGMKQHEGLPGLLDIEASHRSMHDAARLLLSHRTASSPTDLGEYERFMDQAILFKQELRTFQYSLISLVCTVDHLTGAWNRHAMNMKLAEESERTRRSGQFCTLCMMDIDHFKGVNDQHGHKIGDEVLQAFTSIINAALRRCDSLFRYGGEEFLMLLPNTTLGNAAVLLNRIRETLASTPIVTSNGKQIHLTASFGVAQLALQEAIEDALEHADHALLAAKAGGRNQVCVWEVPLSPDATAA